MEKTLPSSTKVVVIGGGVAGCSVAYHLAKFGWKDTILLERDQLTSGTTWHAAGLVGQLGATATITKLRKYSLNLYKELEKKTELSTGLKQNGAITVASSKERLQELLRQASSAKLFDVNVEVLDKQQIKNLYPVINDQDILGGVHMPEDGQADPVGVTNVLAKAARMEGAQIFEKKPVTKILLKNKKVDLVMSDIAPNISGIKVSDQAKSMHLVELAFAAAQEYLKEKGDFVCKMFQGQGADEYIKLIRRHFGKVSVFKPKSSRPDSREVYLIAKRYLG